MAEGKRTLIVVLVILAAVFFIMDAPQAEAAGLTFSASTTVSLTSPVETWTVAGGSNASSVQVGTGNMVVAMQNTDGITLSVSNRNFSLAGLSSSAVVTRNTLCYVNTGNQQAILTLTATQNESITVTTGACVQYATSAGKGAQSSLPTYSTIIPPVSPPTPTPAPAPAPAPAPTPITPSSTSAETFTPLPASSTVADIQSALNEVTERIANITANLNAPNVLDQVNQLVNQIADIQKAISGNAALSGGSTPPGGSYGESLRQGSTGDDVTALQNFLKAQGTDIYPEGLVTGFYGPLTRGAVEQFQLKHGIITSENDPGAGYAGPRTREKINTLLGL